MNKFNIKQFQEKVAERLDGATLSSAEEFASILVAFHMEQVIAGAELMLPAFMNEAVKLCPISIAAPHGYVYRVDSLLWVVAKLVATRYQARYQPAADIRLCMLSYNNGLEAGYQAGYQAAAEVNKNNGE